MVTKKKKSKKKVKKKRKPKGKPLSKALEEKEAQKAAEAAEDERLTAEAIARAEAEEDELAPEPPPSGYDDDDDREDDDDDALAPSPFDDDRPRGAGDDDDDGRDDDADREDDDPRDADDDDEAAASRRTDDDDDDDDPPPSSELGDDEEWEEDEEDLAAAEMGHQRYVIAGFFGLWMVVGYVTGRTIEMLWSRFAAKDWFMENLPQLAAVPHEGELISRESISLVLGALVGAAIVLRYFYKADVRQWADEVAEQLTHVKWPTRKEVGNNTVVVMVASAVITAYLTLLDRLWGFVTNLIYTTTGV